MIVGTFKSFEMNLVHSQVMKIHDQQSAVVQVTLAIFLQPLSI